MNDQIRDETTEQQNNKTTEPMDLIIVPDSPVEMM